MQVGNRGRDALPVNYIVQVSVGEKKPEQMQDFRISAQEKK